MYVIDSSTQSCGAGESGLNWSQNANNGMPFTCPQCNLTFDVDYFEGKDLSNAYLPLVALSTLNLTGTNFTNAYLYSMGGSGTNFENTNFTNADLRYSDLTSSSFSNTNLTNADLSEASLYNSTDMDTATLTGVTWSNTRCPDGSYSNDHSNTCVGHLIP
jgi:uncharacterized protein YjbI with pentapeptide repeats